MWSTLKISSGAQLGHDKWDIPAFDTVLFHSNLSSLRRKYLSDVPTDKIVLSSGAKISKRPLKRGHWWLKNKERKCNFRFVERRFSAAINCTESAEGALVPVLLRITHWTKSGLPVSPPGLFPPWFEMCEMSLYPGACIDLLVLFSLFRNSTLADKIQFTLISSLCVISSSFWWHTSGENIDAYGGTNQQQQNCR